MNQSDELKTIGVRDELTPYIQRINRAIAYRGDDDHEDVRSILKEFSRTHYLPKQQVIEAIGEDEYDNYASEKDRVIATQRDELRSQIKKQLGVE